MRLVTDDNDSWNNYLAQHVAIDILSRPVVDIKYSTHLFFDTVVQRVAFCRLYHSCLSVENDQFLG